MLSVWSPCSFLAGTSLGSLGGSGGRPPSPLRCSSAWNGVRADQKGRQSRSRPAPPPRCLSTWSDVPRRLPSSTPRNGADRGPRKHRPTRTSRAEAGDGEQGNTIWLRTWLLGGKLSNHPGRKRTHRAPQVRRLRSARTKRITRAARVPQPSIPTRTPPRVHPLVTPHHYRGACRGLPTVPAPIRSPSQSRRGMPHGPPRH